MSDETAATTTESQQPVDRKLTIALVVVALVVFIILVSIAIVIFVIKRKRRRIRKEEQKVIESLGAEIPSSAPDMKKSKDWDGGLASVESVDQQQKERQQQSYVSTDSIEFEID